MRVDLDHAGVIDDAGGTGATGSTNGRIQPSVTIVDDEPVAQDELVRAASGWNYVCQGASSAEEAVELMRRRPTPIVVTDLRMPGRDGLWLVQEIRRRWPDTAIIVVTAGDDVESACACLEVGASRYFLKPIRLDELRHALGMAWRAYQLQRQADLHRAHLEQTLQRRTRQLRATYLSAIDSLVLAMEERDPYTTGHSRRVKRYALDLALALRLDRATCKQLSLAAKLHDIGKVGVPEAILNKPARLTSEEFTRVREHPVVGERILAPIIRQRGILTAIRSHHERLDGSGYPDGLKGERISLLARIITIADCFDAMTSARAYREAMSMAEALELLRAGAGKQFEHSFVESFLEVSKFFRVRKCAAVGREQVATVTQIG